MGKIGVFMVIVVFVISFLSIVQAYAGEYTSGGVVIDFNDYDHVADVLVVDRNEIIVSATVCGDSYIAYVKDQASGMGVEKILVWGNISSPKPEYNSKEMVNVYRMGIIHNSIYLTGSYAEKPALYVIRNNNSINALVVHSLGKYVVKGSFTDEAVVGGKIILAGPVQLYQKTLFSLQKIGSRILVAYYEPGEGFAEAFLINVNLGSGRLHIDAIDERRLVIAGSPLSYGGKVSVLFLDNMKIKWFYRLNYTDSKSVIIKVSGLAVDYSNNKIVVSFVVEDVMGRSKSYILELDAKTGKLEKVLEIKKYNVNIVDALAVKNKTILASLTSIKQGSGTKGTYILKIGFDGNLTSLTKVSVPGPLSYSIVKKIIENKNKLYIIGDIDTGRKEITVSTATFIFKIPITPNSPINLEAFVGNKTYTIGIKPADLGEVSIKESSSIASYRGNATISHANIQVLNKVVQPLSSDTCEFKATGFKQSTIETTTTQTTATKTTASQSAASPTIATSFCSPANASTSPNNHSTTAATKIMVETSSSTTPQTHTGKSSLTVMGGVVVVVILASILVLVAKRR